MRTKRILRKFAAVVCPFEDRPRTLFRAKWSEYRRRDVSNARLYNVIRAYYIPLSRFPREVRLSKRYSLASRKSQAAYAHFIPVRLSRVKCRCPCRCPFQRGCRERRWKTARDVRSLFWTSCASRSLKISTKLWIPLETKLLWIWQFENTTAREFLVSTLVTGVNLVPDLSRERKKYFWIRFVCSRVCIHFAPPSASFFSRIKIYKEQTK